jgi:hypothetical protein
MKNKIILTIFTLSILSTLFTSTASAQLVNVGVSKGNVYEYTYTITWNSTNPTQAVPQDIVELNKTQNFQITITDISETTVDAQVITQYRNGTTKTQTGFVNLQTGDINLPYGYLIIPANLNANDKIYPSGGEATINNTTTKTYQSGDRQTNQRLTQTTTENHHDKTNVYYDKTLGIAVSSYYESIDATGTQTETFTETITNTNAEVWSTIPEFPSTAVLMLLLIAIPIMLVAYKKKDLSNNKITITLKQ